MTNQEFTEEQKNYLQGFAVGSGLTRTLPLTVLGGAPAPAPAEEVHAGPDGHQRTAQDRFIAAGKKLAPEEQAKRNKNGLDLWDEVIEHARDGRFPKGTDVFLFKFQGLFYVAPAQDSFMCRLRFPAGIVNSHQMRGLANLSEQLANGCCDVTTRSNLQLREIGAKSTVDLLTGLHDLGIINRGSGSDNIRNVTASPTAGIDPQELIDTRPLARQMHHYILNHREMYGLPRKFNIAFDGGGAVSTLEDTNDIGFVAVVVSDANGSPVPGGVYFRMQLGGITGHQDFARDCGILLTPEECIAAAAAVVRVFLEHGDRTDRKKSRLKYVLDAWGLEKFVGEVEKLLPAKFRRFPLDRCQANTAKIDRMAHVGFHPQKQAEFVYAGIVLPVGRITAAQMRGLASIADRFGSGDLRLTVWQNLLISDLREADIDMIKDEIEKIGLHWSATHIRAGLVACTGNAGCKFAASGTKAHALLIASHLEARVTVDRPVNIHLTGCHHSCAQHYIGDIGLIATKVSVGEEMIEGYHLFVGGGYGPRQEIGRELYRDVIATDAPLKIERMLRAYLDHRSAENEAFGDFAKRYTIDQLRELFDQQPVNA
ncbi:MAG TPA: NirA family protein [Tepidisphaeraceae bacterium]|jgi:ferredoxin-nitrite reductase|nr:NirA family protein [Tepidisphaeraceae bacterium]